jgi:hypothetical protein
VIRSIVNTPPWRLSAALSDVDTGRTANWAEELQVHCYRMLGAPQNTLRKGTTCELAMR